MVICNARRVIIIDVKHIHSNYISPSYRDDMIYYLLLGLCLLKHKACSTVFYIIVNIYIYFSSVYGLLC